MYDKICKKCGTKLSDFYRTYMLGCPECYSAFEREILLALKKIQGANIHTGKMPKIANIDRELLSEYERLIKEKEDAALDGRFSRIKELSAQLVELSEELKRRGLL
ncbi:MAG: hypothetical protein IKB30_01735 [Clostridia bacterium]|nr:hypothetical protein [Clostridia bacterium]MBR2448823.1 hypothetical protein [Clostridia bacterium]